MSSADRISLGLLGLGTVGGGVARILPMKNTEMADRLGRQLEIRKILVRDPEKPRLVDIDRSLITTRPEDVIDDPEVDIIVEVIGGEEPAHSFIRRALMNGKHVVTANKEVLAKHGPELLRLATERGVSLLYEASVGGGIPIIAVFQHDLSANSISEVRAIINGTTNYILTKMANGGEEFEDVLQEAQQLGYAEADPSSDVDGHDAVYKLSILSSLAFRADVRPNHVYREGIRGLTAFDFRYASELGYAIKLLAIARNTKAGIEARVHPVLIAKEKLLAKVDGVFNAIEVEGDLVGRVLFYGQGAGSLPTASAIVADVLDLAQSVARGVAGRPGPLPALDHTMLPITALQSRYYLRIIIRDEPGVLAKIATAFGEHRISIASVLQKETDEGQGTAELVVMTHQAAESGMQAAVREISSLPVCRSVASFIRVEA